jgi:heme A synthase
MNLVSLLITLLVLALVFSVVWWILGQMPIPQPFRWVVNAVLGIICLIVLLGMLTGGINVPILKL